MVQASSCGVRPTGEAPAEPCSPADGCGGGAIAPSAGTARSAGCLAGALLVLFVGGSAAAAELAGRVVDRDGTGIRDAVVFVQEAPPDAPPAAGPRTAVMDQIDKEFVPRVLPVAVGTEVSFPNHDQIHHHVYSFSRPKTFEIPLYKGETATPVRFDQPGAVKIGCNIHDWMSAVILVVPTPYFARTDEGGAFVLRDLPAGTATVVAWHEGSQTPLEATAQRVDPAAAAAPLTLTLDVAPPRRPLRGRSYD